MPSEVFQLAILLSLKDAASGGLDRFGAKLRTLGKDGLAASHELDKIRANLNRDMAIGGVGIAGLGLMYKGVQVAGDFQASMTDLRTTLSEVGKDGNVNFNQLGGDMLKAEAIAMKLGNALPGTTETFISMMQALKQGGLDTQTILNGAAESVANLAVANNALPSDIAEDFAKFGQIYKLKSDEYKGAADLFSRIYTSKGINSGELIQSTKYFQGRAGNALGLTGLKGADESVRLMSYLQKQGLDSSQAGTSASTFFVQLAKNKKALSDLKKEYGLTFDLFDKQGQFKGIDNAVLELEKLKKLNPEQMLVALNKLGGEEGSMAGTAIVAGGAAGWKQSNDEVNKSISLQAKNAEKAKDFNNQMEALTGSVKNLVVAGFEPLLPKLTQAVDYTNQFVGAVQGFAKENPSLTSFISKFALIGTTSLAVGGGLTAVYNGIKLLSVVSKFSSEEKLVGFLSKLKESANQAGNATVNVGNQLADTGKKVGALQKISSSPIVFSLQLLAVGMTVEHLIEIIGEVSKRTAELAENSKSVGEEYNSLMGQMKLFGKVGDFGKSAGSKPELDALADKLLTTMKMGRALEFSLQPERAGVFENFWTSQRPYASATSTKPGDRFFTPFNQDIAAQNWRQAGITMPLQDPNVLSRLVLKIEKGGDGMNLGREQKDLLLSALEKVSGKEDMKAALDLIRNELHGSKAPEAQPKNFNQLFNPPSPLPQPKSLFQNPFQAPPSPLTGFNKNPFDVKPPTFDLNKPFAGLTTSVNGLAQPIGQAGKAFGDLTMPLSQTQQSFSGLPQPVDATRQSVSDLGDNARNAVTSLNNVAASAAAASNNLNMLGEKFANYQLPTPKQQTFFVPNSFAPAGNGQPSIKTNFANRRSTNPSFPPQFVSQNPSGFPPSKKSVGGIAQAEEARLLLSASARNTKSVVVNYSPNLTINGGSETAKADFQASLNDHSREIERIVARQMENGRARA